MGSEVQLMPAERASLHDRVAVMNAAYADYYIPMNVSTEYMRFVDRCNDVDHSRSVIARVRGRTIGIALLGLRAERAWIGGVGVVPEWRRRGVARAMMQRLMAESWSIGARTITLEVLIQNEAARRLYGCLGFTERRELLSWYRRADVEQSVAGSAALTPAPADVLLMRSEEWRDSCPPWQHELAALRRIGPQLRGYQLSLNGIEAAYCVVNDHTATVSVMGVGIRPELPYARTGQRVLGALSAAYQDRAIHLANLPSEDGLSRVLPLLRYSVTAHQVEMQCAAGRS